VAKKEDWIQSQKFVQDFNDEVKKSKNLIDEASGSTSKLLSSIVAIAKAQSKSKKFSQASKDLAKQQTSAARDVLSVIKAQENGSRKLIKAAKAKLALNKQNLKNMGKTTKKLYEQYDAQQKSRKESIKLARKTTALDKLTGGVYSKSKAQSKEYKKMGMNIKAGPLMAMSAISGIIQGVFKFTKGAVTMVNNLMTDLGKSFGVAGRGFFKGLFESNKEVITLGFGMNDVISAVKSLNTEFGVSMSRLQDTNGLEDSLVTRILDSARAMGITATEAISLRGNLVEVVGFSEKIAEQITEQAYQQAEINGLDPASTMKQVAAQSSKFARFGKESFQNFTKTVMQLQKVGLEFGTMEKIQNRLFDVQGTLERKYEAEVLLGRKFNMERLTQLSFQDDYNGMLKEANKILSEGNDDLEYTAFQWGIIEDLFGVTAQEIKKINKEQKDLARGLNKDLLGKTVFGGIDKLKMQFSKMYMAFAGGVGEPIEEIFNKVADKLENSGLFTFLEASLRDFAENFDEWLGSAQSWAKSIADAILDLAIVAKSISKRGFFTTLFSGTGDTEIGGMMNSNRYGKDEKGNVDRSLVQTVKNPGFKSIVFNALQDAIGPLGRLLPDYKEYEFSQVDSPPTVPNAHSGGISQGGLVNTKPAEMLVPLNEFNRRFETLNREVKGLRTDMASYFGFGGTAITGISQGTSGGVIDGLTGA